MLKVAEVSQEGAGSETIELEENFSKTHLLEHLV